MPFLIIGLLIGVALGLVALVATAARQSTTPTDPPDFQGPRTNYGAAIPFVFGTVQLRSPICIYSGDVVRGDPYRIDLTTWAGDGEVTDEAPSTDDPSKVQFRSTIDLLLCERIVKVGVPLGTITLRRIWYGEQFLWDGTSFDVPVQSSGTLLSHDPNLNEGPDEKPGGVIDARTRGDGWWYGGCIIDWEAEKESRNGDFVAAQSGPLLGYWEFEGGDSGPYTKGLGLERVNFYSGQTFTELENAQIRAELQLTGEVYPSYPKFTRLVFEDFCWGVDTSVGNISTEITISCPAPEIGDDVGLMADGLNVNPVSVLYQLLTCQEFTGALALPACNIASFSAARQVIDDEQLGMSYRLSSVTKLKNLVEAVLDHVDGMLYRDPLTGEICVVLNRAVSEEPPTFDQTHVIDVLEISKSTWTATYSQVRVNFEMLNLAGNDESAQSVAVAKDPALAESSGTTESLDVDMPTIYSAEVANNVAARKLSQVNTPLTKVQLSMNRLPSLDDGPSIVDFRPGQLINWDYEPLGVVGIALRILEIDLGELDSNAVTVTFIEDRYQAPNFIDPPEGTDDYLDPPPTVAEITTYEMFTAPYFMARADIGSDARKVLTTAPLYLMPALPDSGTYAVNYDRFAMFARKPYEGATEFIWNLIDEEDRLVSSKVVPYTLAGELQANIAVPAENDGGATVTFTVENCDLGSIEMFNLWAGEPDGRNMLMIGQELFLIIGRTWVSTTRVATFECYRRMLDSPEPTSTIPAGTTVWFLDLSDKDWISKRLGPVLESSREQQWYFDFEDPTDGMFNDFQATPNDYTAELLPTGVGKQNLTTNIGPFTLADRANRPLPVRAVDFAGDSSLVASAATTFQFGFESLTTIGRLYQQREIGFVDGVAGSLELLLVPEQDSGDLSSAESIANGGLSEAREDDGDHVVGLEVWYEYLAGPMAGVIKRTAAVTDAGDGMHTFECPAEAVNREIRCYLRAVFAPTFGEANRVPIRRSVPRIFMLTLERF